MLVLATAMGITAGELVALRRHAVAVAVLSVVPMIVLFAAQKTNWLLLVALATAGSALGGYLSYQVGQSGGMAFLEKHVPPRIFKRVCGWMESHAILAVALPLLVLAALIHQFR